MKKLTIALLTLLPFAGYSTVKDSTSVSDTTKIKKLEIGVSFSPDYCFRSLKADGENQWIADSRDTSETGKFGYTVGADLAFKLNKHFNLQTGILFSDSGERTKKTSTEDVPYGQQAIEYSYNNHHYYLNVPVRVDYKLLTGKLKLYVMAGVSANFFLGQKITTISTHANSTDRVSVMSDPGFSTFNLAVIAGCGIKYPVSKRANIKLEPVYRRSLTPIMDTPVKSYLYSAGINFGIFYEL